MSRGIYVGAQVLEIPSPSWIIEGYLPEQSLDVTYGPPKSGKTFVALDMALHVANSLSWCGNETLGGGVLYVLAEGIGGVGKRIDAWLHHYGFEGQEQRILSKFVIQTVPLNLLRMRDAMELFRGIVLDQIEPRLVVIDTLARNMVGADENSSKDMGMVIHNLDVIRNQLGKYRGSVLVLHHSGKDGKLGARGSSALPGAADVLTKVSRSTGDLVTVEYEFMKEWDCPDPLALRMLPVNDSLVLQGTDRLMLTSGAGGYFESLIRRVIDIVRANPGIGKNEIKQRITGSNEAKQAAIDHAVRVKAVRVEDGPNRKQLHYYNDAYDLYGSD